MHSYIHTYIHIFTHTYMYAGVTIEPYEHAISFLQSVRGNVWMDAKTTNIALYK